MPFRHVNVNCVAWEGSVLAVRRPHDKNFAFVDFESTSAAEAAIAGVRSCGT